MSGGAQPLGYPRLHLRATTSTNERGRELALRGAPDGTLVTAAEQSAGRGRQGRSWFAPPGRALLCSLVLRDPPQLLALTAGVALAELLGPQAQIKWPNDVLVDGRKVAGILVEGRAQERWAVLGIGVNVAVREQDFGNELRGRAGTLGLEPDAIEPMLARLLESLERWLAADRHAVIELLRRRDALLDREVRWDGQEGRGAGIDEQGRLVVVAGSGRVLLEAGEVQLV